MNESSRQLAKAVTAYLALGSNLGDREATIRSAIAALDATPGVDVIQCSSLYETEPVGPPGQGRYINAAAMVRTTLSARDLLHACLNVEVAHGRRRTEQQRWTARSLDIDVLLYGDQIIDDAGPPHLRVPHPRMAERLFVLDPLVEVAADVVHPTLKVPIARIHGRLKQAEYRPSPACFD